METIETIETEIRLLEFKKMLLKNPKYVFDVYNTQNKKVIVENIFYSEILKRGSNLTEYLSGIKKIGYNEIYLYGKKKRESVYMKTGLPVYFHLV